MHICCSVDSHYFLQKLREIYPHENLIGFFYNPNIHPRDEYDLRLQEVRRSCENLKIPLICGEYEMVSWLESVAGFENAEEKGERCAVCFESRLIKTALLALNLGESKITTTLLTSPMKPQNELFALGDNVAQKYALEFMVGRRFKRIWQRVRISIGRITAGVPLRLLNKGSEKIKSR